MSCSSRQRAHVDKRLEFTCVTNSAQQTYRGVVVNVHAAIRLAFVLGIRAGLAQPHQAGDFMARWIDDTRIDSTAEELGLRHQQAMMDILFPVTEFTPEEYEHVETQYDEEGG